MCPNGDCQSGLGPIVLFGGLPNPLSMLVADTWEWDGTAWTQRAVTGPSARYDHAMASLHGKVVLFGGRTQLAATGSVGDTWEWDGTSWTQRAVTGPLPRFGHSMAALNGRIVLFGGDIAGGSAASQPVSDTWEWDGLAWTQRCVPGPPARVYGSMTAVGGKIVLFGGETGSTGTSLADAWTWDGSAWTQIAMTPATSAANPPAFTTSPEMTTLAGNAMLLGAVDSVTETWVWNTSVWQQAPVTGPSERDAFGIATLNGKAVIFGGTQYSLVALGDTWEWDGQAWTQRSVANAPSARYGLAMATK
jgi:hypothetical protein